MTITVMPGIIGAGFYLDKRARRCSPGMSADIALVLETLMLISSVAAWRLTALSRSYGATAEDYNVVSIGEAGHMNAGSNPEYSCRA